MGETTDSIAAVPAPRGETEGLVSIVVAARPIARGEKLEASSLRLIHMQPPVPAGSFGSVREIRGGVAIEALAAGQIVMRSGLVAGGDVRPGLSVLVPEGMRAVALRVTDEVAVGNFVRPGDRIDIQLILPEQRMTAGGDAAETVDFQSRVLLDNVEVLTVGDRLSAADDKQAIRMQNITVAVSGEQALLLSLAKERGRFYLALRHPNDDRPASSRAVRIGDLVGAPPRRAEAEARTESAPRPEPVAEVPGKWVVQLQRGSNSSTLSGVGSR